MVFVCASRDPHTLVILASILCSYLQFWYSHGALNIEKGNNYNILKNSLGRR